MKLIVVAKKKRFKAERFAPFNSLFGSCASRFGETSRALTNPSVAYKTGPLDPSQSRALKLPIAKLRAKLSFLPSMLLIPAPCRIAALKFSSN